jgi:hypothetical protein
MILLSARGFTAQEIAEVQRVTDVTIYKWIRRFREGGPSSPNARLSAPRHTGATPFPLRTAPTSHRSPILPPGLPPNRYRVVLLRLRSRGSGRWIGHFRHCVG